MPRETAITLVLWHEQYLVGDAPFPLKSVLKVTHPLRKTPTSTNFRRKLTNCNWKVFITLTLTVTVIFFINCKYKCNWKIISNLNHTDSSTLSSSGSSWISHLLSDTIRFWLDTEKCYLVHPYFKGSHAEPVTAHNISFMDHRHFGTDSTKIQFLFHSIKCGIAERSVCVAHNLSICTIFKMRCMIWLRLRLGLGYCNGCVWVRNLQITQIDKACTTYVLLAAGI